MEEDVGDQSKDITGGIFLSRSNHGALLICTFVHSAGLSIPRHEFLEMPIAGDPAPNRARMLMSVLF